MNRVIRIEAAAPPKPAWGEPCNGCGVCCLTEPCPVGILLSRRLHGPCTALRWDEAGGLYRCAVVRPAGDDVPSSGAPGWIMRTRQRVAARWIAAGQGCDCSLEIAKASEGDRGEGPASAAPDRQ